MSEQAERDRSLLKGLDWSSLVTWGSQMLSWSSTLVVAHLLTKADYGLIGMASLFLGMVQMVSEFGLGAAVVRFQTLTDSQLAQFNGLSIGLGAASLGIGLLAANLMGRFFHEPRLPFVIVVMCSTYLISAFRVVPYARLQRELEFKRPAMIDGAQAMAGALASVVLAWAGLGYRALAFSPVVSATVYAGLAVATRPTRFQWPDLVAIKNPVTFSAQTLLTRFAWYGYSNADFVVVGRVLGTDALGAYFFGWYLAGIAVEKITALVGRVTPAFLAAVQNDLGELRRYLIAITEGLAYLTFPACVGIALVASNVVPLIGAQWASAVAPLQLLAILATVRSIDPLVQQTMAALGESRTNLNNSLLTVCILPFGLYAGTNWGLLGVTVAWLIIGPLLFGRLLFIALRRIELPPRQYFASLWPATSACLVMALTVILVERLFLGHASVYVSLGSKIAVGAVAYVLALLVFHRQRVLMIRDLLKSMRQRSA